MPNNPSRDDIVVSLPVYEPAGQKIQMSLDDLSRHTCLFGSTGAGKSTLLMSMLEQVLAFHASDEQLKPAVIVFAGKGDSTPQQIGDLSKRHGRANDVQLLDGTGGFHFDMLADLGKLGSSRELADQLLHAVTTMGSDHGFWDDARRTMLTSALLLLNLEQPPTNFREALACLEKIILRRMLPDQTDTRLNDLLQSDIPTDTQRHLIEHAAATHTHWSTLDPKTRSNIEATLTPLFNALHSPLSHDYFGAPGPVFSPKECIKHGLIQIVCCDAVRHPDFARLLFRQYKEKFFGALQERKEWQPSADRLVILVADEWPLVLTERDTTFLATCRAKGCGYIAGTQGLASIDEILGTRSREALLLNINNLFLFRNTELEIDQFAARILSGPGTLSGLHTHQAFVKLGSRRILEPVWFVPSYPAPLKPALSSALDPLSGIPEGPLLQHLLANDMTMQANGYPLITPTDELLRLFDAQTSIQSPDDSRHEINLLSAFSCLDADCIGLTTLPPSWRKCLLAILPRIFRRTGTKLTVLAQSRGRLVIQSNATNSILPPCSSEILIPLMRSLYPSPFRQLKDRDRLVVPR